MERNRLTTLISGSAPRIHRLSQVALVQKEMRDFEKSTEETSIPRHTLYVYFYGLRALSQGHFLRLIL